MNLLRSKINRDVRRLGQHLVRQRSGKVLQLSVRGHTLLGLRLIDQDTLTNARPLVMVTDNANQLHLYNPLITRRIHLQQRETRRQVLAITIQRLRPSSRHVSLKSVRQVKSLARTRSKGDQVNIRLFTRTGPVTRKGLITLTIRHSSVRVVLHTFVTCRQGKSVTISSIYNVRIVSGHVRGGV